MALKLFEFVQQFMMDTVLIKLTKFQKTGSIGKTFISLGNLIINFHFRNSKSINFFVTVTFLLFDGGFCLPVNNRNALNLNRNHKSNREKSKLSVNKFSRKKKKNQQDLYKSTHCVH